MADARPDVVPFPGLGVREAFMNLKNLALLVGPLVLLAGSSCFSAGNNDADEDCDAGDEACECSGDGTCNAGLTCRSNVCVDLAGGGSGGTSGVDIAACLQCGEGACPDESAECEGTDGCNELIDCLLGCSTSDTSCAQNCQGSYSTAALSAAQAFAVCSYTECASECITTGSGGTSAGGTAGTSSGGTSSGGTSSGGSGASAGTSSGGTSSGGTGGTSTLLPGSNWLVFDGNVALETTEPNGSLGVNGVLYGFTDGCATMTWDPATRCATGNLCVWSATNWGVAVGFDFYNTGETGSPADTKYPWSAAAVQASGVAWSATVSSFETMSVWLTNMDPSWAGACAVDECGINGPPDGTAAASSSGQLLFSSMVKEDWGGSGTPYTFDPSNILAMQFKLPGATSADVTAYTLCVDQIAVIR
jgi:hypothetical protein